MGQILGFSCEHLSTVALVCNLYTGHVSPQYHAVFDDKLKTVFHDGKMSAELDKIVAELFANNREHFVEDEYDDNGHLIYRPPPLDKVWLLELERHHRCKQLEEQHDHAARQQVVETQEVKKQLKRSHATLPDLVESDIESDCEDSFCEEPPFESGGDKVEIE
ncbi:hypothetical protein ACHAW6_004896 [Cyclotella cf. meneghiniana]